ncbi:MAG: phenylacetate--CoA ligase family protein [Fimbriimonadaceae bacterium]|nr:phenylacetate--CoA ligase family protein [Fimbriimonadaceae bacterium]
MPERPNRDPMVTLPATGDYEVERQRHVRALAAQLPGEVDKLTWPLERLHALRDERLRALVRTAKARSPWHARRLRHVDPDALRGDDLAAIPPMTKADLMAHWDEIVTDRRLTLDLAEAHLARVAEVGPAYLLGEHHVVASGGSSGTRGIFVWDFDGWLEYGLLVPCAIRWLARRAGRAGEVRRATVIAAAATHLSGAAVRTFAGAAEARRSFPVTLPLSEIVAGLNAFAPTHISAYPSMLHRLALEARAGRLRIAPLELSCSSEPLLPEARRVIQAAFAAPVLNTYGSSEVGIMARSFPGGAGLHLMEDVAVYEPVDAQGRLVPPGTPAAKLLVTNVINHALPLIRYELTDEVTFLAEPNPGPWTGRRIADIQGRLDDGFTYAGGVVAHPHVFRSALGRLPEVTEYQVRQTPRGADIAVRVAGDASAVDLAPVQRELVAALTRLGLADPAVVLTAVAQIDRLPGTGKLRRFVPLVS